MDSEHRWELLQSFQWSHSSIFVLYRTYKDKDYIIEMVYFYSKKNYEKFSFLAATKIIWSPVYIIIFRIVCRIF